MKKNTVLIILVLIVIGFIFYRSMGSSFGASGAMNTLSVKNESGDYLFVVDDNIDNIPPCQFRSPCELMNG